MHIFAEHVHVQYFCVLVISLIIRFMLAPGYPKTHRYALAASV